LYCVVSFVRDERRHRSKKRNKGCGQHIKIPKSPFYL
jgi:hypothetical protein